MSKEEKRIARNMSQIAIQSARQQIAAVRNDALPINLLPEAEWSDAPSRGDQTKFIYSLLAQHSSLMALRRAFTGKLRGIQSSVADQWAHWP
jgi:hypothetical protein